MQPRSLETREASVDGRRFSPSTGRNKDAVRAAYLKCMPDHGHTLEVASGTGEHGAHITASASGLTWTYSDVDPVSQASQSAWRAFVDHDRLLGPLTVDTTQPNWGEGEVSDRWTALFCANMIHIAPFEAAEGLIAGAGRLLKPGGRMMLYGPFARNGQIAPSNARFSEDLKRRDPRWGVRDLDQQIIPLAQDAGMELADIIEMPANNLSVVFEMLRSMDV